MDDDAYDLERFVTAQDSGGTSGSVYHSAMAELQRGRKTSHWMWFVFPQVAGLGQSPTSRRYAIASLAEAQAYLRHPVLGPRLAAAARVLTERPGGDADQIFGALDAQKLRSSMTLFHRAGPDEPVFGQVLAQYFGGQADESTDRLLSRAG